MKKIVLLALIFSGFFSLQILADETDCDAQDVHCAYVTGLKADVHDGRWLKVSVNGGDLSQTTTECFNNRSTFDLTPDLIEQYQIKQGSVGFSICTDENGTNCQMLGYDNFSIIKNDGKYTANPPLYTLDLSTVKDKFPQCNAAVTPKISVIK